MSGKVAAASSADLDKLRAFLNWVAAVCGKTYARKGDAFSLADDEAHHKILDRIEEEFGEKVILENEDKKLSSLR
jgi:hypothetical protein